MRTSFRYGIAAVLIALLFSVFTASTQPVAASNGPIINEFSISTDGTDVEYIEIFGTSNTDYSAYTVLGVEGGAPSSLGVIDNVIPVGTTDANGYERIDLAPNTVENDTVSLLLVEGFTGAANDDIDSDDDGAIDGSPPWMTLADSVAVQEDPAHLTYGPVTLDESFDDAALPGNSFAPGGASRIPNGTDTDTTTDWVRNDFDLAPLEQGSPEPGEALNTPGAENELVPIPPPITNNCFYTESFEALPGDTYTLSNIFDDGSFDYFGRYFVPDVNNGARDDFQIGWFGSYGIQGQDHDGEDAATQIITLETIDVSTLTDIDLTIAAGALDGEPTSDNYEDADGDGIDIFASIDGGLPTYIGGFATDGTDGDLYVDTNADGTGDGPRLTTSLNDFTFDVDGVVGIGSDLDITIELTSTSGFEPLAVDHVRLNCTTTTDVISTVQGTGDIASEGPWQVEGIVVASFQGADELGGFFLQEEDTDADANAATSEGIFVNCGVCATAVAEGDRVQVTGAATETSGMGIINAASYSVIDTGNTLPSAAQLDLPVVGDIDDFYESTEGMLVEFVDTLYVSEYFQVGRYGQIVLYEGGRPYQFTQLNEPDAAGLTAHLENLDTRRVILDDDDNIQNSPLPNGVYYYPQPDGLKVGTHGPDFYRGNDEVQNLVGVLHWSWAGNDGTEAWRIRPTNTDPVEFTPTNARPDTPEGVGGNVTVGVLNVLNYFTTIDDGSVSGDDCGPTGNEECRGADSTAELDRQAEKIVAALVDMDADVIGLVELENSATDAAVSDLVTRLNAEVGMGTYDYVPIGFVGSDVITNGIIYNTNTVEQTGDTAVLETAGFLDPNSIGDDKNRPAVTASFEVLTGPDQGEVFTVSVNHLKSKGSPCGAGDDDTTTGQGNCNDTRTKAAQELADWLATDPTNVNDDDYLIIGDLNAYAMEDPIDALKTDGYADLLQDFVGPDVYTYLFDGQVGTLDYVMSNASATSQVAGATAWNINADEVPLFDYNDDIEDSGEAFFEEEADGNDLYEANEFRSSDHDAVLVGLNLGDAAEEPASVAVAYDADENEATVTWGDVEEEEDYVIERQKAGATDWTEIAVVNADIVTYTDGTIVCGQEYTYRVIARNTAGTSTPGVSNSITANCEIFADVPGSLPAPFMEDWVETFFYTGITTGKAVCDDGSTPGPGELFFCPQDTVTRGDMAVFILRALNYPNLPYTPEGADGQIFADVPSPNQPPIFEDWIEEFFAEGITQGCAEDPLRYCPEEPVSRGAMAVFIMRAITDMDYTPQGIDGQVFTDVPSPNQPPIFEAWIEDFYALEITTGCNNGTEFVDLAYCPEDPVTRGAMAVFIMRAFDDIPDPNDP